VKKIIHEIHAFIEIQKYRLRGELATEPTVLHAIFKGNPGTGKTTVARIVGKLFREIGVLPKGQLVEVERADLVGEFIGHTAQKTREQLKKALGGILFIDEAYSLARGGEKDFGKEAIDVLVKAMEDHKDELIVILAGYKDEMEFFLKTNPGLRSRFPIHVLFPDYQIEELMEIAQLMLAKRQYQLSDEAIIALEKIICRQLLKGGEHSGNARLIRNIVEFSIRRQAVRLINKPKLTRDDLMIIESVDLLDNFPKYEH
jgi:stage V sporulation protein K